MREFAVALFVVWIALAALAISMSGCTITHGDDTYSLMTLAPGDDIQTRTTTMIGIEAAPMGVDGPQVRVGYVRSQQSRVPGYEEPTMVPSVRMTTKVDDHGVIVEEFEVSESRSWFK